MLNDNAKWIELVRSKSASWFALADRLSSLGEQIASIETEFDSEEGLADYRTLTLLFFFRSASNFRGTILMAERAMIIEARTLARSCGECAICLAGLKFDPEQWRSMLHDELASRKGRAKLLARNENWLNPDDVDRLRAFVEKIEAEGTLSRLDFSKIAINAGIEIFYLLYRQLSADAAHPSIEALNRYIIENEDGAVQEIQPVPPHKSEDIDSSLSIACNFFFLCITVLLEKLPNEAYQKDFGTLWEEYKRLIRSENQGGKPTKASS